MRRICLALLLIAALPARPCAAGAVPGVSIDPLSPRFAMELSLSYARRRPPGTRVHAAFLGDAGALAAALARTDGRIVTRTGSVVTAVLRWRDLLEVAALPCCRRVEPGWEAGATVPAAPTQAVAPIELARSAVPPALRTDGVTLGSLADVRAGRKPLGSAPTGRGVVVAVIESGGLVDFRHPDFRREDGSTRFLAIWDQADSGEEPPRGRASGRILDAAALDALIAARPSSLVFGDAAAHVTSGASVAAGSGAATGDSRGVAPEARLLQVRTRLDVPGIIDAAAFAFEQAASAGLPCVVTISESPAHLQGRPEDGGDPMSVALTELVEAAPGRVIVSSAGNNAHLRMHSAFRLDGAAQASGRWRLSPDPARGPHGLQSLRIGEGAPEGVRIELSSVPRGGGALILATEAVSAAELAGSGGRRYALTRDGAGFDVTLVPRAGEGGALVIGIEVDVLGAGQELDVRVLGAGSFETWTDLALDHLGADEAQGAGSREYVPPDSLGGVSSPACARGVIAAGAFFDSRPGIMEGTPGAPPFKPGGVAPYSQPGGPAFGSWKPLLLAPTNISAAIPLDSPEAASPGAFATSRGHAVFSGTSCAGPVLAGAIALYLERHPQATSAQVADALARSAVADADTGTVPSPRCGHGKLDFLRFLATPPRKL